MNILLASGIIREITPQELTMQEDTELLKDWTLETREVSAGMYRVRENDSLGRSVEKFGIDPDRLLAEGKAYALKIINRK